MDITQNRGRVLELLAATVVGVALARWLLVYRSSCELHERHPGLSAIEPGLAEELALWDALSDEAWLNVEEHLEENLTGAWPEATSST